MTEGRGNAVREDDELDLEQEGEELGQINGADGNGLQENTAAHDYPDDGPLSVTRQVNRSTIGLEDYDDSEETSADGDDDNPPRPLRKDDDTGSIPDDSPSVQVSLFPVELSLFVASL